MHETYCTPSAPSRRGLLAAGAGFAGIATAQLFAAQAVAAGTRYAGLCRHSPSPVRDHSARHSRRRRPRFTGDGRKTCQGVIQGVFTPIYQPEDAYISELVASLNQLNAGVTTTVDTSQVSHTPAHSDACIAGLKESGRRAVHTYSPGVGPGVQYPKDLVRLQSQYFSSPHQRLTLQ